MVAIVLKIDRHRNTLTLTKVSLKLCSSMKLFFCLQSVLRLSGGKGLAAAMFTPKAMQACLLLLLCSSTAMAKMSRWERILQAGADATVVQAPAVAPAAVGVSSGPLVRGLLCMTSLALLQAPSATRKVTTGCL